MFKKYMSDLALKYKIGINSAGSVEKILSLASNAEMEKINKFIYEDEKIDTVIFGNGDVQSIQEAEFRCNLHKLDGVMIGRGVFKNPFIFNCEYESKGGKIYKNEEKISIIQRLRLLKKHILLWEKTWLEDTNFEKDTIDILLKYNAVTKDILDSKGLRQNQKHFPQLKKYFKIYISGFDGATAMRAKLMESKDVQECLKIVNSLIKKYEQSN